MSRTSRTASRPPVLPRKRVIAAGLAAPLISLVWMGLFASELGGWANYVIQLGGFLVAGGVAGRVGGASGWAAAFVGTGILWIPASLVVLVQDVSLVPFLTMSYVAAATGAAWIIGRRSRGTTSATRSSAESEELQD